MVFWDPYIVRREIAEKNEKQSFCRGISAVSQRGLGYKLVDWPVNLHNQAYYKNPQFTGGDSDKLC